MPEWRNVSSQVGNGSDYFRGGSSLINQAFKMAQDGLSEYQVREKENADTREANNTAKLLDIAKVRPLTQSDYDAAGMVDRTTLNKMLKQQEKQDHDIARGEHSMSIADQTLALSRKRTAAEMAKWASGSAASNGKPSYWQKKTMDNYASVLKEKEMKERGLGSYGKSKSGGGSDVKALEDVGITLHTEDKYGTAEGSNYIKYQRAVRKAQAANIPKKTINLALSQSSETGGFWGEVSGVDEMSMDVPMFLKKLNLPQ